MSKKTGLEKFMDKSFTGGVKISSPAETREVQELQNTVPAGHQDAEAPKARGKAGRPPKTDKVEKATIIIKVDWELKRKIDEVKYITHKSTMRDVVVEALYDIVKKYGL